MRLIQGHHTLLILLCFFSINTANSQCGNPPYQAGAVTAYDVGEILSHNGNDYRITVAGWANGTNSAYEPGVGFAWTSAWTLASSPCSAVSSHCAPTASAPFYEPCVSTSIYPYDWPSHQNWFVGDFDGSLTSQTIDMSTLAPTTVGKASNAITGYEGVSSVSDDGGNLLFFSNGRMNWDKCADVTATTLLEGNEGGGTSVRGSASQGIIIVRHALDHERYHAFTTDDAEGGTVGFNHFLLNYNGVVQSAQRLGTYRSGESVAATLHENGVDIWVTTHQSGSTNLHSYLVKCDGTVTGPVTSAVTVAHSGQQERGGLAFSFDGSKLVKSHSGGANETTVHTFDKATGVIGAGVAIPIHPSGQDAPYDVVFSPDGSRIYISTATGAIISYDVSSMNGTTILSTRTVLGVGTAGSHAAVELGPGGVLYQSGSSAGSSLRRINGNLNTGGAFSVTNVAGTRTWKGLPSMYLPPAEEPDIQEVGPYTTCDGAVDLSTLWMCRGGNAEDPVEFPAAYQGNGITDNGNGIFNPATAGVGTHEIIFTRCSVDDTINIVVGSCCPDTTLSGSFSPFCASTAILDLTTVENGKVGTWTVTSQPAGGDASITGGDQFNSNSAVAGTYVVRFDVTGADPSCVMPTRSFIINALPIVTVNNSAICAGDAAATFTATSDSTAASHLWSVNGTGTASTTTGTTAGNYTVAVTDNNGCVGSGTGILTVNIKPNITVADQAICSGDAAAVFDAGTGFTSYQWSGTGGSTDATQTTQGSTAGTYVVHVEDANGCRDTATATLTVNAKPIIVLRDTAMCSGASPMAFDAGAGFTSYQWSGTGGSTDATQTTQGSTAGTYVVHVEDANGCRDTATATLTVNGKPTINPRDTTICQGDAAITFDAGAGFVSYQWSGTGGSTDATQTTQGSTAGNYIVEVEDVNGCRDTALATLNINAKPFVSVVDRAICSGDAAAVFDAGAGFTSYQWSGTGGSTDITQTTQGTVAGTYVIHVEDVNGCRDTASATLTVNTKPDISVADAAICSGDAAAIFDAGAGFTSYQWSGTGGSTDATQTTAGITAGTYVVHVEDANGCRDTATATLTVNVKPTINPQDTSICAGDGAITFDAGAGYTSYQWSGTGGSTDATQTTQGSTAGTYVVHVEDANGCRDTATATLTVNAKPIIVLRDTAMCSGASPMAFDAGAGFTSYQWSGTGGSTDATQTTQGSTAGTYVVHVEDANGCRDTATATLTVNGKPTINPRDTTICQGDAAITFDAGAGFVSYQWSGTGGSTDATQTTQGSTAGSYIVEVEDVNGCRDTALATLNVDALPVVTVNNAAICSGDAAATFTATSDSTAASHLWSVNGTGTASTTTGTTAGNYTVAVTDNNGCVGSGTGVLTVNLLPVINVNNATICAGDPAVTFAVTSDSIPVSYVWSGNGSGTDPTTSGNTSGYYRVTITDGNGCEGSAAGLLSLNTLPVVTVNNAAICAGDAAATFTATSDSSAASHLWSVNGTGTASTTTGTTAGNYTVAVTDNNGCVGSGTGVLTVHALPVVTVNNAAICIGDAAATFTATSDSTAASHLWSVNGTGTASTTTGTTAGNYTVAVTDNNGCVGSGTGVLTVNTLPVVTVNNAAICAGDAAATFTATSDSTAASHLWSVNGTGTASTTTGTTAGNYTVAVTDNNGCVGSGTGVLAVNVLPVVTVNSETICSGDAAATFTATSDSTAASHLWSVNGTGTASTTAGTTAGNYTVAVTDNNGCVGSGTGVLTVNALPVVTVNNAAICTGDAAATFTATSDSTAASHLWSVNGTGTASTTTGTTAGNYTVAVTDNNGCVGSGTGVLKVNTLPVVTVNSAFICSGDPAATFTATSDSTAVSHLWSANGTGTAATTTGAVEGMYTVALTDNNGCIGSGTGELTENMLPTVTLNDGSICPGSSLQFDAGAGYTYLWHDGSTNQTYNATAAEQVNVTITDGNGCIGKDTANVTLNASLAVDIGVDQSICAGETVSYNITNSGYSSAVQTVLWSTGETTDAITVSTASQVTVTVTDPSGCFGTDTANVLVNVKPNITLVDQIICAGDTPVTFDAGAGYTGYNWTGNSTGTSQTMLSDVAGIYTVDVVDANGCRDTASATLTVNALPTVTFSDRSICPGTSTQFDAGAGFTYLWHDASTAQTYTSSSAEQVFVTITDGNGCLGRDTAQVSLQNSLSVPLGADQSVCQGESVTLDVSSLGFTDATHTILWSTGATTENITVATSTQIDVVVTDASGCSGRDTVNIVVNSSTPPVVPAQTICDGDGPVTFDAGPGYASYVWKEQLSGTNTSQIVSNAQTLSTNVAGSYSVNVVDNNTCEDSAQTSLSVNTLPSITFGDRSICPGTSTQFDAGVGFTYLWQDGSTGQTYTASAAEEVYVTITDGNNCVARDTANVTLQSNLSVPLGQDQSVCQGNSVTLDVSTLGYTTATHTILWSTGETSESIVVSTNSQIDVAVTDGSGCAGRDTINITINQNPSISLENLTICEGDGPVLFDAGAGYASYNWSGAGSGSTQTYSATINGTYNVEVVDNNGCIGNASGTLTVNPVPAVILSNRSICPGTSTQFDAGAGFTYLWQDGSTNQTFDATTGGEVHVLISDGNGCSARDTALVSVQGGLLVDLGPDRSACEGNTITLNCGYPAANYTILWDTGESTDSISVATTGEYTVEITDAGGCKGFDTIEVQINTNPTVSFADQSICVGDMPASFDAGNVGSTFVWSGDASGSAQTYLSAVAGTFNVTVTDANGCSGIGSASLNVNSLPTVELGDTVKLCPGIDHTFNSSDVFASYEWNGSTTNNQSSFTTNAFGDVWLVVTDSNGCVDVDSTYLFHYSAPVVDLGNDEQICIGESITVSSGYSSGSGYTSSWSTGATSESVTVSPSSTETISVFVDNGAGCPGYDEKIIRVNALPIVSVTDQFMCSGDPAITFVAVSDSTGFSYVWSDGTTASTMSTTSAGSYNVTVTDLNGCAGEGTGTLTVHDLPAPSLSDNSMCFGTAPVSFSPGSTYSNYLWSGIPAGETSSEVTGATAGTYGVEVTDANGCKNSASATLTVHSNPVVYVGGDLTICEGQSVTIGDAAHDGTTGTLLWSSASSEQYITASTSGVYKLNVVDGNGCQGVDSMLLTVNPIPGYTKQNDTVVCFESIGTLALSVGVNDRDEIYWDTGSSNDEITIVEKGIYPFTIITPSTLCEVKDTIVVSEKCISTLFIPNAFSPNGDGTNDFFFAKGINVEDFDLYVFNRWGEQIFHSDDLYKGWDGYYKEKLVQIDVYVWKVYYSTEEDYGGRKKRTQTGTVTVVR